MSTRCTIVVRPDKNDFRSHADWVYIYHHCDGDPGGVGEELDEALNECFIKDYTPVNVSNVVKAITDIEDTYRMVDHIAGDSSYVYVIDVDSGGYPNQYWPKVNTDPSITIYCYETPATSFNTDSSTFSEADGYTRKYIHGMIQCQPIDSESECKQTDIENLSDNELLALHMSVIKEIVKRNINL